MEAEKQSGGHDKPHSQPQFQHYTYPFQHHHQHYGTFHPSHPAIGFPQPSPPPPSLVPPPPYAPAAPPAHHPQGQGYQPLSAYAVVTDGRPVTLHHNSVPFCGIGIGWILFIAGFFFAAIPWYVGALIFLCVGVDHKEKPGLIACTIAALIAAVAILLGLTNRTAIW